MSKAATAAGIALVLAAALGFAYLNGAEHVTLRLGFATFYRIPLPYAVFGAFIVGMLVMFAAGIHADLRVRRILRDRLVEEDLEERAFYDRYQQELWDQPGFPGEGREEAPRDAADAVEEPAADDPVPAEGEAEGEPERRGDDDLILPGMG